MGQLPTGTVTFLFSDIEGSTRLAQSLGHAWPPLLERHREIARAAWAQHHGTEVLTEGDSFFVVFESAPDAVAAAVATQRALAAEAWPEDAAIRVRMGIHTGEGQLSGGSYVGLDVHRAARIAAAGHGGQVLLSGATHAVASGARPQGVSARDLGEHRLKDLSRPERIWSLVIEGLRSDFPPPATLNAVPNNLPTQLTTFLGREREIAEASQLLNDGRLLTLTGPGGTGKTRLSLQIAADATARYPDGIYFVPLGTITRADLVLATIAQALGMVDPGLRPLDRLAEYIGDKCFLLILDNFEQVSEAATQVAELLIRAPRISVLVTSRSALRVYGEREYPVPPLETPDPDHLPDVDGLSAFESVALFVERAMSVRPDFGVTSANARAVAEICARLDGLPLAIELAAARIRVLSPAAIMERLGDRLALLSSGPRDLPERQQTLRGAIAWSYDLLDESDRRLFTRLAPLAGGATLAAIVEVVLDPGERTDVVDAISSLVDKSLVRQETQPDGQPRFRMLETIREYAAEQLAERGEADQLADRFAAWVVRFAEQSAAAVFGQEQRLVLDAFELEHDNIRAALTRAIEEGSVEVALRLLAATWRFWQMRGYLAEGRKYADRVTALPWTPQQADLRAAALEAAGGIAYWQADMVPSRAWYGEALELARASGDQPRIANALYNMSFTYTLIQEDIAEARRIATEAADIYRQLGDDMSLGRALWGLANTYYFERDSATGIRIATEGLEMARKVGDRFITAWSLYMLGLYLLPADTKAARRRFEEALPIFVENDDKSGYALLFDGFATLEWVEGDVQRAVRLAGYAAATEQSAGTGLARLNREFAGFFPETLMTDPELATAFAEGQRLTLEQVTDLAMHREERGGGVSQEPPDRAAGTRSARR